MKSVNLVKMGKMGSENGVTDNGSEFINWQLFKYCLEKEIVFTRGRPTKKNDNAHIEQKNWTHIRKIVGYSRLETEEELGL